MRCIEEDLIERLRGPTGLPLGSPVGPWIVIPIRAALPCPCRPRVSPAFRRSGVTALCPRGMETLKPENSEASVYHSRANRFCLLHNAVSKACKAGQGWLDGYRQQEDTRPSEVSMSI
jgi:hypothetical protein